MKKNFHRLAPVIFLSLFLLISLSNKIIAKETGEIAKPKPLDVLKDIQADVGSDLMPVSDDPILIIVRIINYLINLVGVAFLIMIIYGGIMWMTARGNEEQTKKAKAILKSAAWGLVIVVLARVLYIFVRERISPPQS